MRVVTGILLLLLVLPVAGLSKECETPRAVTSPCTGVLLPTDAAAEGLRCLEVDLPTAEASKDKAEADLVNFRKLSEASIQLEKDRNEVVTAHLERCLEIEVPSTPWYKHPAFVAPVSFAGGVGLVILVLSALNSI